MPVPTVPNPVVSLPVRRPSRLLGTGLVLLALWVQALAPMAALRMALAGGEWLPGAVLCGHVAATSAVDVAVEPPFMPPACEVCRLCRAGLSPPPWPSSPVIARSLRWISVAWSVPPPSRLGPTPRFAGQPRAPPVFA